MIRCKATGTEHRHETVADVKICYAAVKTVEKPAPKPIAQPATEAGIYRKVIKTKDAELTCIYRVKIGKSGHAYAEALVLGAPGTKARFVYQMGLIKTVTADMKMTKEQAIEYGMNFGICCRCGKVLTKDTSVEKGIGPVCIKKF